MSKIDHITRQVETDRARLAQSLDALTDTLHPQRVTQEMTAAANDIGGDLARKAWETLRDNPAGGLLVSIGLGLLASGSPRRVAAPQPAQPTAIDPDKAFEGFDERLEEADAEMRAEMTGELHPTPQASKLKAALHSGLDQLPPRARKRVVKAREAVISTQESIERKARRAARRTSGFVNEQPLTVGALALGFGILAGTLLPGTRKEDEILGQQRDALMADARKALEEEMLKARDKAERAMEAGTGTFN